MFGYSPVKSCGSTVKKNRRASTCQSAMSRRPLEYALSPIWKSRSWTTLPVCWAAMARMRSGPTRPMAWSP